MKNNIPYTKKVPKINKVRQGIMMYEDYIGFEKGGDGYAHLVNDNLNEILSENNYDEVNASDISLSTFKPQDELNPKFWVNKLLNSRVRLRLLDIADNFIDELEIDWVKPYDIILTGSLTNYNWSRYSDIDLHIVYKFDEIDEKVNLVKDYLDSKRKLWNDKHDSLKIYGYPIEIYVQDKNEIHQSSGVYSLERNEWIIEPNKDNIKPIQLDKFFIKEKAAKIMNSIDYLCNKYNDNLNDYELNIIGKEAKNIFKKIKYIRKHDLSVNGEMSNGNLIYKILRRSGYIDKIVNIITKTYDLIKSIK